MKLIKIAMTMILGMTLLAGIACGGLPKLPDLVVEEFSGGGGWCVSSMTVTVKNIGTADAGPFTVTVEGTYPPSENWDSDGESINVSGLPAGQETSLQFEYHYFASGTFAGSATATVDAAAQVTESNESNNEIINVQSMPEPCPSPTPTPTPNRLTLIVGANDDMGSTGHGNIHISPASLEGISDIDVKWENAGDHYYLTFPRNTVITFTATVSGAASFCGWSINETPTTSNPIIVTYNGGESILAPFYATDPTPIPSPTLTPTPTP